MPEWLGTLISSIAYLAGIVVVCAKIHNLDKIEDLKDDNRQLRRMLKTQCEDQKSILEKVEKMEKRQRGLNDEK